MDHIDALLPQLEHYRMLGYWLVFLVAFLEAVALIGVIVPGSTLIVFAGALAARGVFNPVDLICFAIAGAILGDGLSFWLGQHGADFFKESNKVFKPDLLEAGTRFFRKHGAKSVFLGRFVGVVRMVVPLVAGLSHMEPKRFYFWNITSAFAWAISHILAGYLLGHAWRVFEVWTSRVGIFLGILLVAVFCAYWLKRLAARRGEPLLELAGGAWRSLRQGFSGNPRVIAWKGRHPGLVGFIEKRFDGGRFSGLPLTFLALAFVYILFLLGGIIESLLAADPIVALDLRLADLFHFYRDDTLVRPFLWISQLGTAKVVVSAGVLFALWLWMQKKTAYILPFWITLGASSAVCALGKTAFQRSRPAYGIIAESSFSFPSGHATIAMALYGFLIYYACRRTTSLSTRLNALFAGGMLIAAIGLSRLYLGAHFLSDVLGGYLLGALWLIIGISLAELRLLRFAAPSPKLSPARSATAMAVLLIAWMAIYIPSGLHRQQQLPAPVTAEIALPAGGDIIGNFGERKLPRLTESIAGNPRPPLNFILVAKDEASLSRAFQAAGWHPADPVGIGSLAHAQKAALANESYPTAPISPSFWNGKTNDIGFEKPTPAATVRQRYQIRLWKTALVTADRQPVFVGQASLSNNLEWGVFHKLDPDLDAARESLYQDLIQGGLVENHAKKEFAHPLRGHHSTGDPFFTDGQLYVITLR